MALTTAQLQLLKTAINADGALAAQPLDGDGLGVVRDALNALAVPDFIVWLENVLVENIFDAITWVNYTPTDAADSTVIYSNRLLLIQTKQMNLQNILVGRNTIDARKSTLRAGLRDAVIQLPAGAGGAFVSAGGASAATVLAVCTGKGTRAEKILTLGPQTTGTTTADIRGFAGNLTSNDIDQARHS